MSLLHIPFPTFNGERRKEAPLGPWPEPVKPMTAEEKREVDRKRWADYRARNRERLMRKNREYRQNRKAA